MVWTIDVYDLNAPAELSTPEVSAATECGRAGADAAGQPTCRISDAEATPERDAGSRSMTNRTTATVADSGADLYPGLHRLA